MKPAGDAAVPVTRAGAVGALKLLMIVLSAAIFWQAAAAVNAEFQARELVTAPPFLRGASRLFIGTETPAPFQERLSEFWAANHRLVALAAMLVAAVFLVTRYLVLGRVLDFLYLESEAREKRIYSGFLANIMLMLAHAGAIYAAVFFSRRGPASAVAIALLALFALNLLWIFGMMLAARPVERNSLRGLRWLGMTTLVAALVLLGGARIIETSPAADDPLRGSALIMLSSGVAAILCLVDGYLQGRAYHPQVRKLAKNGPLDRPPSRP